MTQKQLIELIQQHHPVMGETEIRLALNRAQDDFCYKTELIKDTSVRSAVKSTAWDIEYIRISFTADID